MYTTPAVVSMTIRFPKHRDAEEILVLANIFERAARGYIYYQSCGSSRSLSFNNGLAVANDAEAPLWTFCIQLYPPFMS